MPTPDGPSEGKKQSITTLDGPSDGQKQSTATLDGPSEEKKQSMTTLDGPSEGKKPSMTTLDGPSDGEKQSTATLDGPSEGKKQSMTTLDGPSDGEKQSTATLDGPSDGEKQSTATLDGPSEGKKQSMTTLDGPSEGKKQSRTTLDGPHDGRTQSMTTWDRPSEGKKQSRTTWDGPYDGRKRSMATLDGPYDGKKQSTATLDGPHDGRTQSMTTWDGPYDGKKRSMVTLDGPHDGRKQSNTTNNICQVCGDHASIINYGALSCLSCRTFFRRNAHLTKEVIACRYDGSCEVNMLTRKVCTACRLAKCRAVGMSSELIRKDLPTTKRKSRESGSENLAVMTVPQQSALDLPDGNGRIHLVASDWTLISNVVHAFDAFSPVSEVRRAVETLNASSFNQSLDVSQSLHLMSSFYHSLQSFISSIPDFKILTPSEQCSLFQRNMLGLLCIGGMYFMRESGIFDKPESEMLVLPLYGTEVIKHAKVICQQLNYDPIVFKLMLVALAFSSNCYMIQNPGNTDKDSLLLGTFRLLGSQNVYIELMWKYLMYRYDYQYSVNRFSNLIGQVLGALKLSFNMYENNRTLQNFINDIMEQIQTSFRSSGEAITPLWGKK
ncbi:unnamed protein product [Adineta steineri]|uniref:Nuclear receptor domain-containing protein n=1 Tax=Adineta steineri TaxID=433720 RepID=A0A815L4T5_9BILA|nr:unnamed protein product [Adineta steineri]